MIPEEIKKDYEKMEQEKTKFLIAEQAHRVVQKEEETKQMQAKIQAETDSQVSQIKMYQQFKEKENQLKIAQIEHNIQLEKAKSEADSQYYERNRSELRKINS